MAQGRGGRQGLLLLVHEELVGERFSLWGRASQSGTEGAPASLGGVEAVGESGRRRKARAMVNFEGGAAVGA
jgi:hypothetical protein